MSSLLYLADIACFTSLIYVFYCISCRKKLHPPNSPPIAHTYIPWFGSALNFVFRRTSLLHDYRSRYGDVYKFLAAGQHIVVVSSPTAITKMFDMSPRILSPPEEEVFQALAGLSERLPYIIGLLHRTGYVFIANALQKRNMESATIPLSYHMFRRLQSIANESGTEICIPICDFVSPSLYGASFASFFGTSHAADTFPDFAAMDRGIFILFNCSRFFAGESYKAREHLVTSLEPYVRRAWENGNDGYVEGASSIITESLRELLRADLSISEASRVLVAVLWGFHSNLIHTTINALAYILSEPLKYSRISANIRRAIDEKFPDFEGLLAAGPDVIDSDEFAVLDSVIQETLRVTAVGISMRKALCDTQLTDDNGRAYFIQKGEYVVADVRGMHHNSALFPEPQSFVAERFINSGAYSKARGVRSFRPWGGGAFICKGREYARFAIKMFLVQTMCLFEIKPGEFTPSLDLDHSVSIARLRGHPVIHLRKRTRTT